jgi:Cft2 family RNA processing exonuclease
MATVGTHEDYENEVNRDPEGTNEVRKCDVLLMTHSQVSHLGQSFVLFLSCPLTLFRSSLSNRIKKIR